MRCFQQEGGGRKLGFLPACCSGVGPGTRGSSSKQKPRTASVERAGVSAAQNGGSGSSGVVEMVSKAGHLTSEAQPQGGGLEGGRLGRGHPA